MLRAYEHMTKILQHLNLINLSIILSMYGRLHQRKLKEQDYIMSCQKARRQLDQYIDLQAKRVNIDSAKKRAVLQHMDYQGFRQMVLGANIFPTKSQELYNFSKGKNAEISQNKLFNKQDQQPIPKTQSQKQMQKIQQSVEGKSQFQCFSFSKFYSSELNNQNSENLYSLIKNQNLNRLSKIFNIQCEGNILSKIAILFNYIIDYLRQNDEGGIVVKQAIFMIKFFEYVICLKAMQMNLTILSKKQRKNVIQILQKTKILIKSSSQTQNMQNDQIINGLIKKLEK